MGAALAALVGRRFERGGRTLSPPPDGAFVPAGCDAEHDEPEDQSPFEESLEEGFWCPRRLEGVDTELVEEVNLWHYAMLNDESRSQFFWDSLRGRVEGKRVLDLGAGSGLLSMMAAKLGAASVVALEASSHLAALAERNIERNGLDNKVSVVHALSSSAECPEEERAELVVSETLGTLLNGESTVDYLADALERLAVPGAIVVPAGGAQHCVLVSSPTIKRLTGVASGGQGSCHGLDLSAMDGLRDTAQTVSPNAWGLRLAGLTDLVLMSDRMKLFELDFSNSSREGIPLELTCPLVALRDGVVHAVVATWEVWGDPERNVRLATHLPEAGTPQSRDTGFLKDSHFSQAMQVLEDAAHGGDAPVPFVVSKGERLLLRARHNESRTNVQFDLQRIDG